MQVFMVLVKYMRIKNYILIAVTNIFLLSGCGSSPNTSTLPSTSFELFPSDFFTPGYSEFYDIKGTDTNTSQYTGDYSTGTLPETTFDGNPAIPYRFSLEYTQAISGALSFVDGVDYFSTNIADLKTLGFTKVSFDAAITTVSANPAKLPIRSTINKSGLIGTYTDNAGNTYTQRWRLDGHVIKQAKLVFTTETSDQFGNKTSDNEVTYIIDTEGNRLSVAFRLTNLISGITINLSGKRV
jgi:hypothetical protein